MKATRILLPLFIVALVAALGWLWLPTAAPVPGPDITLRTLDGRAVSLRQLHGRPVLVTFWASTCSTCLKEMPHLAELHRELSPRGLEIIGIAMYYDPPNRVLSVQRSRDIPYTIALDIEADAARAFGNVQATPTSFLIDPDGMIVYRNSGVMNLQQVRRKILEMIAKHGPTAPESGAGKTG